MLDKVNEILSKMTLEEKASLCSGKDFWHTKGIDHLGIPSIMVTDGPHGLRKQEGRGDHVAIMESVPATCFPTASASACTWDVELMQEMGKALGEESLQEGVSVILGPGANIKRSPLCGRNFEYISEDPYLTGEMAAALINGVQSKGIGTSLKHYAINNQETRRMNIDAVVDERTQREIYLAGFEAAVKKAQPWTVMCSYNRVGGTYLSDNKHMLTDILKEEWGHTGLVVTDWGACNNRVEGIRAGMELEMPSSSGINDAKIVEAVKNGTLTMKELDKVVARVIELLLKSNANLQPNYKYSINEHRKLAKKIAQSSAVLLKNEDLLPLSRDEKIAIIGEFAKSPRYQGAGSSRINPHKIDNVCDTLSERKIAFEYARGYDVKSDEPKEELIVKAIEVAKSVDKVVLFAGLTDDYESEGFDRNHMRLPKSHNELIIRVLNANPNTIIVLLNGAPIEMPWVDDAKSILECYLGGETGSEAAVDILFGNANPSGKLAETFPVSLMDTPCYNYFPGNTRTVEHREGIFVGYRYYDTAQKDVLFPFGHGLSYTQFEYSNLKVEKQGEYDYTVNVTVKNVGEVAGAETVQLYVKNNKSPIFKAEKELRRFAKVYLNAGEEKEVTLTLNKRSFAYYNVDIMDWHVDSGDYTILVGASSRDIKLSEVLTLASSADVKVRDMSSETPSYYKLKNEVFYIDDQQFEALCGKKLPPRDIKKGDPFDPSTLLVDTKSKLVGRVLYNKIMKVASKRFAGAEGDGAKSFATMFEAMIKEMPLRAIGTMAGDGMPKHFAEGIVHMLNGKYMKGAKLLMKK